MKKALLLVDYTYDFVADDGKLTCGKPGQDIAGRISQLVDEFVQNGEPIVVLRDLHYENDTQHPESKLFPPHNIFGTPGRELYGQVKTSVEDAQKKRPDLVLLMDKTRYSAFARTDLAKRLEELCVDTVVVVGVCTHICILHTAIGAYNNGFEVIVPRDAVATFDPAYEEFALEHMKSILGAKIL